MPNDAQNQSVNAAVADRPRRGNLLLPLAIFSALLPLSFGFHGEQSWMLLQDRPVIAAVSLAVALVSGFLWMWRRTR